MADEAKEKSIRKEAKKSKLRKRVENYLVAGEKSTDRKRVRRCGSGNKEEKISGFNSTRRRRRRRRRLHI